MKFNNFDRIVNTVNHREVDRVPLVDLVDFKIQSEFLNKEVNDENLENQVEFWKNAGFDYIPISLGLLNPGKVTDKSFNYEILGTIDKNGLDNIGDIKQLNIINSLKDLNKIDWNMASNIDYSKFEEVRKYLPNKMKIVATTGKIFTLPWMLMGFTKFCESLYLDPELIVEVVNRISEIQLKAIKNVAKMDHVGAIWIVDDIAFGTNLMVSKDHLKKYFFPIYKQIAEICKQNNILTFFHSDGKIEPIINDLIEIGIDAIHPIDPNALDIKEIKEKYGKKIAIFGNVDVDLLARGSIEDVKERVKYLLKNIAPSGGYCLGSGNSIPPWAKFDNFKAMVDTCLKYGSYPINL